jgi:uncharacterized cupin superfamily protein
MSGPPSAERAGEARVTKPSIADPHFDERREHPGFNCRRARLGRQAGTEKIGLSLFELPPGEAAYPYHFHLAEEEVIVVLTGRPSLRTRSGWRELDEGDVVAFPTGEEGAHQIVNHSDDVARFLAFSNQQPDVIVQPDSRKVGAFERRPDGSGLRLWFREHDAAGYWDGEQAP